MNRREQYIQYYKDKIERKDFCCTAGEFQDRMSYEEILNGNGKPVRLYDSCFCIIGFGLSPCNSVVE